MKTQPEDLNYRMMPSPTEVGLGWVRIETLQKFSGGILNMSLPVRGILVDSLAREVWGE